MGKNYTKAKKDEFQQRIKSLVRAHGRMTQNKLERLTGAGSLTVQRYVKQLVDAGELYEAPGRAGIFLSEKDFLDRKENLAEERYTRYMNRPVKSFSPYDRDKNGVCEECRGSEAMQWVLAFYRGYGARRSEVKSEN
ncbi:DUF977 family protein [Salmonella enterica subsp. enterica serovar Kokomlemle]